MRLFKTVVIILFCFEFICCALFADDEITGEYNMVDKIKKVKPAVVKIISGDDIGSGFVVTKNGHILTCNHVVKDKDRITVQFYNGRKVQAKLVKDNQDFDYSILKIDGNNFSFLTLGDYKEIEEGEDIYVCGYPFNYNNHTTHKGMISSKPRGILGGNQINLIQLDSSINSGNSGGPLLNLKTDRVVGIVTRKAGGAGMELDRIKENITRMRDPDSPVRVDFRFFGMGNFYDTIKNLIDAINIRTNVGIGFAYSIEYAKEFVEAQLKETNFVVVKTHSSDKYGRYLADIFYLKDEKEAQVVLAQGVFLNQELLKANLAAGY